MSTIITLTVRGRPVGYRRSRFGGELIALERGYFPVSSTGYRSLARGIRLEDAPAPDPEFLETLATNNDAQTARVLQQTRKLLRLPHPDGLAGYAVLASIDQGLFARDADRILLWHAAYALADRILRTPALQPTANTGPAWTPEHCARLMGAVQEACTWLKDGLAGRINPLTSYMEHYTSSSSYFALPERSEPIIGLPELTTELALPRMPEPPSNLDPFADDAPIEAADAEEASVTAPAESPHQLVLF